jgi:hypothetical protein
MTTAASDDLIARVRAHLAGLEPPVRADDLTDEEVAGLVMASLVFMEDYGEVHYSLPERFRPRTPVSLPPITTMRDALTPYLLKAFAVSVDEARRRTGLPPLWPATPSGPPPGPR